MRDQGRAPLSRREGPSRPLSHDHLRRRLPWPHPGDAGRDGVGKISRRLRPPDGGLRPGCAWRYRRGEKGDRSADRRNPDRADPGRGRCAFGNARLPEGVAPALRREGSVARLRRGANRHGSHRRSVRVPPPWRRTRRDVVGQGTRRRLPDRRVPCDRGSGIRHDAGLARLDLRGQSARDLGCECRARRHAQARLLRSRAEDVAAAQAEARLRDRPSWRCRQRSARRGPPDRHQGRGAFGRSRCRLARREAAHRRCWRQCRAFPAAFDRHRSRDRGQRRAARARLHRVIRQQAGGKLMSKSPDNTHEKTPKHFLDINELPLSELKLMLAASTAMKAKQKAHQPVRPLEGKTLAMIFERPSTRTRVSFDVAMRQLGGEPIMLTGAEMQLGRGETIADTARVLSRYVDAIMIRILNHDALLELAANATVPVINGLTRRSHPCQVMADLMTYEEHRGPIEGKTVAWTGDDNNVLASWAHAAERFKFQLNVATPPELAPKKAMRDLIKATGAPIMLGTDAEAAVRGADCVVTDTWVSMGDKEGEHRHNVLKPYQVNAQLMSLAKPDALFMHCLPAHRGEEGTDEVIDGPQSVVFDEAENRLHAQKGILAWCFDAVK